MSLEGIEGENGGSDTSSLDKRIGAVLDRVDIAERKANLLENNLLGVMDKVEKLVKRIEGLEVFAGDIKLGSYRP